jgi:hypothetical protein
MKTKKSAAVTVLGCLVLLLAFSLGAGGRDPDGHRDPGVDESIFTLNALDYRLNIFDLRQGQRGLSRQIDEHYREFIGDILFTGEDLVVLENDRYSGHFISLGEERKPDSEFSLFHSLRLYKRNFQVRQFPFLERFIPYPRIDATAFFTVREPVTSMKVALANLYLVRLFHRTRVGDERVFLLRILEQIPGVKVTVMWREVQLSNEL